MIKASNIVRWLWSSLMLMGLLMLVSCTEDSSNDVPQRVSLHLLSVTRTGDDLDHLENGSLKLFVTTPDKTSYQFGVFSWTTEWETNDISVKENSQYYFYGYWPSSLTCDVSATNLDNDFSKGADLTLSDLPVFTNQDILVIVGVKKVSEDDTPHTIATEGNYGYMSGLSGNNYVNLLMDHLYSQVKMKFCVAKDYYALRRIHLKTVTLKTSYDTKVTATVRLRAGYGLADRVTYSPAAATPPSTPASWPLLNPTDPDDYVDIAEASDDGTAGTTLTNSVYCPHYIFNNSDVGTYVTIESTYDVYDTKGNPIRVGCTASNIVRLTDRITPGMIKTIMLVIEPTYLYVLGDPDLDNPTIKITN